MKLSAVVLVVITLLVIGCSQPASPAGPSPALPGNAASAAGDTVGGTEKATPVTVPFKGRLQGEADPPVFEPPPSTYFTAHLQADGEATHLGRFTMDFSHRVNLVSLVGIGTAVFTAANGDRLMTDVQGEATPAGTPTQFTIVETHTVTGGTGRFASARGEFRISRAVDFLDPSTSGEIDGWISAPGDRF
jgi:hypothetical protein